jgi:hypothetical protein
VPATTGQSGESRRGRETQAGTRQVSSTCPYRAPFKLQEVVQVTVLPPMHDLQTLTHWFICFAS